MILTALFHECGSSFPILCLPEYLQCFEIHFRGLDLFIKASCKYHEYNDFPDMYPMFQNIGRLFSFIFFLILYLPLY